MSGVATVAFIGSCQYGACGFHYLQGNAAVNAYRSMYMHIGSNFHSHLPIHQLDVAIVRVISVEAGCCKLLAVRKIPVWQCGRPLSTCLLLLSQLYLQFNRTSKHMSM